MFIASKCMLCRRSSFTCRWGIQLATVACPTFGIARKISSEEVVPTEFQGTVEMWEK